MRVSRPRNKSVVAAVALTTGLMLAPGATTTASALPPCCGVDQITYYYYSTSAKTTEVGEFYSGDDCGTPYQWGQVTPYYKIQNIYCATSTP